MKHADQLSPVTQCNLMASNMLSRMAYLSAVNGATVQLDIGERKRMRRRRGRFAWLFPFLFPFSLRTVSRSDDIELPTISAGFRLTSTPYHTGSMKASRKIVYSDHVHHTAFSDGPSKPSRFRNASGPLAKQARRCLLPMKISVAVQSTVVLCR